MTYLDYINGVTKGEILTGELTKLAVERHLADLQKQNTPGFPYYFDEKEGERWIKFASLCNHWKGSKAKTPIVLEAWQQFYFMMLFGWRNHTGRRFRNSYLEIARKNGKTTLAAVIALGHLILDKEEGAQAYFVATKEDQAKIGFRDVQEIIKSSPPLREKFKNLAKSTVCGNSFIRPLGSDSDTQDGYDPSLGIVDEYHAHPTSAMLNVLRTGMGMRRSPLINIITTAGFNRKNPCYTETRKACVNILRGITADDRQFALIYSLDKGDDWNDRETWSKSNPNISELEPDYLRDMHTKAINEGGSMEVEFKTKNLNVWTDSDNTWITDRHYMECVSGDHTGGPSDIKNFAGKKCRSGLDLASVRDTCAWVLDFKGEKHHSVAFFFLPESALDDREGKNLPYRTWAKEGYIILTPGNATDYNYIRKTINEVSKIVQVESIEYDRFNSSQLIIDLNSDGFTCNPFGQGFASMSAPTKELEKLVANKMIDFGTNPVMRWMFSNIAIQRDSADNIKISKVHSSEKVDGPVALVMAIGGHLTHKEESKSPYLTRGVRTL